MTKRLPALLLLVSLALSGQQRVRAQAEVKVQRTSLTRDQEIQLGKEAAAEVERTTEVVRNPAVEGWLNQIGQRLAKTPQANAYPYYFKLVNDDSVNAFALPGGPMYVHTGLIKAADTEAEVAGVLAHEMSHVALRHGAAQLSKQQTWGTLFGVIGAVAGAALGQENGDCGLWCQAVQKGAGLGANSVLLKFSRGYEHDADLNGARMMASAGYNPIELANFFEKLEARMGTVHEPKGLAAWLSDHPTTGSRVEYVSQDIETYPERSYTAGTGEFPRVKTIVASLPGPKPQPAAMLKPNPGAAPRTGLPAGFKDYQAAGFSIAYPADWQAGQAQTGGSLYLVPKNGVVKSAKGGVELIAGAMIDYYRPKTPETSPEAATSEFLQELSRGDSNLRAGAPERARVGGKPAQTARLTTRTSQADAAEQTIRLYMVPRDAGVWYVVLAAPSARFSEAEPLFRQMVQSIEFPD